MSSFSDLVVIFCEKDRASPKYLSDLNKPVKYYIWLEEADLSEHMDSCIHQYYKEGKLQQTKIKQVRIHEAQTFNCRGV